MKSNRWSVLAVARTAFVDAIAVTSAISAVLVAVATVCALLLIPRGFRADASH